MLTPLCTCCAMQAVLSRTSTYEDSVRWARCLSEIVKQAGQLCNESAKAAYVEVSTRLQVSKAVPLSSLSTTSFREEACQSMLQPMHASSMCNACICELQAHNALQQPTLRLAVRAGTASVLTTHCPNISGGAILNVAVG